MGDQGTEALNTLLSVKGLRILLPTAAGLVTVVDGVDYEVEAGQVFGIAGEDVYAAPR